VKCYKQSQHDMSSWHTLFMSCQSVDVFLDSHLVGVGQHQFLALTPQFIALGTKFSQFTLTLSRFSFQLTVPLTQPQHCDKHGWNHCDRHDWNQTPKSLFNARNPVCSRSQQLINTSERDQTTKRHNIWKVNRNYLKEIRKTACNGVLMTQ